MKPRIALFNKFYFYLLGFSLILLGLIYFLYPKIPIQVKEVSAIEPFPIINRLSPDASFFSLDFLKVNQSYQYSFDFPEFELQLIPITLLFIGKLLFIYGIIRWASIPNKYIFPGLILWAGIFLVPVFSHNSLFPWIENIPWIWASLAYSGSIISIFSAPTFIFKLARSSSWPITMKNFLWLNAFLVINLFLSLGTILGWIENIYQIPIILYYLFQIGIFIILLNKYVENAQRWMGWGLTFVQISFVIFQLIIQNDSAIKGFLLWNTMAMITGIFLFLPYLYTNFNSLLKENLPFHRVILKAKTLPISIIWVGVLLLLITWNIGLSNRVYHLFRSGIYNHQGIWELHSGKKDLAKISFENGQLQSRKNTFSNLHLAAIYQEEKKSEETEILIANILQSSKNPLPGLFLAQLYHEENQPFQSLFLLKKLQVDFPQNNQIIHLIGKSYEKLNLLDSANYFYKQHFLLNPENPLAQTNYLGSLSKKKNWDKEEKTILMTINLGNANGPLANATLLRQLDSNLKISTFKKDFKPSFQVDNFAYLNNSILNQSSDIEQISLNNWIQNEDWIRLFPEAEILSIWQDFHQGKRLTGFKNLLNLITKSQEKDIQNRINLLENFHQILLKDKSVFSAKTKPEIILFLEKHPFNFKGLMFSRKALNKLNEESLAYNYCFDAHNLNPDNPFLAIPYILQAYHIGEETYAEQSLDKLKQVNREIYEEYEAEILAEKEQLKKKRQF